MGLRGVLVYQCRVAMVWSLHEGGLIAVDVSHSTICSWYLATDSSIEVVNFRQFSHHFSFDPDQRSHKVCDLLSEQTKIANPYVLFTEWMRHWPNNLKLLALHHGNKNINGGIHDRPLNEETTSNGRYRCALFIQRQDKTIIVPDTDKLVSEVDYYWIKMMNCYWIW